MGYFVYREQIPVEEAAMCPIQYYRMMINCKDKKMLRMRMVLHYKEHKNVMLTARIFNTTRKTVFKWLKRYDNLAFWWHFGISATLPGRTVYDIIL